MNHLPQYFGAFVSDIAGAFQVAGGSVAGVAIQALFKKRLEAAREILLHEIRAGEKDVWEACDVDEVVAIVYRYMRASQEGTAGINLRLLARIIAGQKAAGALKADEFLYYADVIASLRYEEIVLLGKLHRFLNEELGHEQVIPTDQKAINAAASKAYKRAQQDTIESKIFSSEDDFQATCGALTRTGLIYGLGTWDNIIRTSPLMEKLAKLASFENLKRETETAAK